MKQWEHLWKLPIWKYLTTVKVTAYIIFWQLSNLISKPRTDTEENPFLWNALLKQTTRQHIITILSRTTTTYPWQHDSLLKIPTKYLVITFSIDKKLVKHGRANALCVLAAFKKKELIQLLYITNTYEYSKIKFNHMVTVSSI